MSARRIVLLEQLNIVKAAS